MGARSRFATAEVRLGSVQSQKSLSVHLDGPSGGSGMLKAHHPLINSRILTVSKVNERCKPLILCWTLKRRQRNGLWVQSPNVLHAISKERSFRSCRLLIGTKCVPSNVPNVEASLGS